MYLYSVTLNQTSAIS
jgi:splicing factor 3B subunit 3